MSFTRNYWEIMLSTGMISSATLLLASGSAFAESGVVTSKTIQSTTTELSDRSSIDSASTNVSSEDHALPNFRVGDVQVIGSTVLNASELESVTQALSQQAVAFSDLRQAAEKITQLYLQQGFTTSRAVLPPQEFQSNGTVTLQVIEGWLGEIQLQGNQTLQSSYIKSRLRLAAESPLNLKRLEAQIRLLEANPMIDRIEARLRAGSQPGESLLVVNVEEAKRYSQHLSTDNYSSTNGLPDKTQLAARYLNPSGFGDELSITSTFRPSQSYQDESQLPPNYDVSYRMPVNAKDGTVQLRTSLDDRRVGETGFADLGLRSRDEVYSVTFRQPLLKSLRQEFAVSLGFSAQKRRTFLFEEVPFPFDRSANAEGITQTRVLQLGQDYHRRDTSGTWSVGSVANLGLDIFDATKHSDSNPDGQFFSWQLQGQRIQRLGKGNLLIAQGNLQLSPNSLLSSEQFNLGGGQSVRGFRQNARSGDNGWRLSVEGRFPVIKSAKKRSILQLTPFADAGAVWNSANNPNGSIDQKFLVGAGMGLLWQPSKKIGVRLDYGVPLVKLRDRSNNFQDSGFYFSIVSEK